MNGLPWVFYALLTFVLALLTRSIVLEIRGALRKNKEEGTTRHFNGKLKEYAIVGVVCVVAYFAVIYLKDGPLQGVSESLWGKPPETFAPSDPFHNLTP